MGVLLNDPDIDFYDLCWYNMLAVAIFTSVDKKEGLISVDDQMKTHSCYVELHWKGLIRS